MRHLSIAVALLLSCTAAPAAVASPSPTTTASATAAPIATTSPSATAKLLDLSIVPAGAVTGDHALMVQYSQQPGGEVSAVRFWDVPLDGTTPRQLVSYNQGPRILTSDQFDPWLQLSPDGRQLALTDPLDMAGTGVLIVDLVAGTTRSIRTATPAGNATWSPDGQRVAFRGFTIDGPYQKETGIWVVPAGGGAAEQVWTSDLPVGSGATTIYGWTEDGAGIAFSRTFTEISVVDVRTKAVTRISGPIDGIAFRAKRPSVAIVAADPAGPSPTGPRGAPGSIGRPGRLEVRDTTLSAPRTIYRHGDVGTLLWDPRWSPTSDEVLMHWVCGAGAAERAELVVVDAVTGTRRVLPTTTGCVRSVSWNGDGSKIIYSDLQAVHVRNADGSGDRELFRPGLPPGAFQHFVVAVTAFAPR